MIARGVTMDEIPDDLGRRRHRNLSRAYVMQRARGPRWLGGRMDFPIHNYT